MVAARVRFRCAMGSCQQQQRSASRRTEEAPTLHAGLARSCSCSCSCSFARKQAETTLELIIALSHTDTVERRVERQAARHDALFDRSPFQGTREADKRLISFYGHAARGGIVLSSYLTVARSSLQSVSGCGRQMLREKTACSASSKQMRGEEGCEPLKICCTGATTWPCRDIRKRTCVPQSSLPGSDAVPSRYNA